jgi:hypothetical protein
MFFKFLPAIARVVLKILFNLMRLKEKILNAKNKGFK